MQKSLPALEVSVIEFNVSFIFYFFLNSIPQSPGTITQDFTKFKITYTGKFKRKGGSKHTQKL